MAARKPRYTPEQQRDIAIVGEALSSPQGAEFLRWLRRRYFDRFLPTSDHVQLVAYNAQRGLVADVLAHLAAFQNPGKGPEITNTED